MYLRLNNQIAMKKLLLLKLLLPSLLTLRGEEFEIENKKERSPSIAKLLHLKAFKISIPHPDSLYFICAVLYFSLIRVCRLYQLFYHLYHMGVDLCQ